MAANDATKRAPATKSQGAENQQSITELPAQLGELSDEVLDLLNTQFELLKEEIKEDVIAYIKDAALVGVGGLVATIGLTLLNVPQSRRAGAIYLGLGGLTTLAMLKRMANRNPLPQASITELKKDKDWLKKEAQQIA